jgi:hypothetical protein
MYLPFPGVRVHRPEIRIFIIPLFFTFILGQNMQSDQGYSPPKDQPGAISQVEKNEDQEILQYYRIFMPEERILFKRILTILGYEFHSDSSNWTEDDIQTIIAFQSDYGLNVDGLIGPETITTMVQALESYLGSMQGSSVKTATPPPARTVVQNQPRLRVGDIVKYFHPKLKKSRYARVAKITGNEVTIYDHDRKEYFTVDIDEVE